jgi:hypothetical protein
MTVVSAETGALGRSLALPTPYAYAIAFVVAVVAVGVARELSNAAILRMIRRCEVAAAYPGCHPERGEAKDRRVGGRPRLRGLSPRPRCRRRGLRKAISYSII